MAALSQSPAEGEKKLCTLASTFSPANPADRRCKAFIRARWPRFCIPLLWEEKIHVCMSVRPDYFRTAQCNAK
jgi:hypothetical protein